MQPDEIMDLVCSDATLTGNALLEVGCFYYVCWERGQGSQDLRKPEEN